MTSNAGDQPASVADLLLHLSRRVRQAESVAELRFIAVNETRALADYRQAALWLAQGELVLSGVVSPEANAPYAHWLQRIFRSLAARAPAGPVAVTASLLDPQDAGEWEEWLPASAVWLPFGTGVTVGGLLLARDAAWEEHELRLLGEWSDIWWHAYDSRRQLSARSGWMQSLVGSRPASTSQLPEASATKSERLRAWFAALPANLWRSRWKRFGIAALLCAMIPVRLTVLAPGELVPDHPSAIRAPLEGTVDRFFVSPNQRVKSGEPLFQLDLTALSSRLAVAQQELSTSEAEYRQSAQQAVFETRSKSQLATLQGRISERKTEVTYLESQLQRAQIVAPRDGVVLVDDPSEWIGKPVATGEKVMTIAAEYDVEVEAWLAPGDLIDMTPDTVVTLYLNAAPLHPVAATLLYAAHEAVARPDGTFAYRLRAKLKSDEPRQRVGLKGTARVSSGRVPLVYWMLRRPLAIVRPYLGL